MAATTESQRNGQFIVSEGNGTISREKVTVVSGAGALPAGRVVGMITASSKVTSYDDDNNDGSETAYGILINAVDATSADVSGVVIRRYAEVSDAALDWASTNDSGDKTAGKADLAALGIIIR